MKPFTYLKKILFCISLMFVLTHHQSNAGDWLKWTSDHTPINAMAVHGDITWMGTDSFLVKFDMVDNGFAQFNPDNSPMPSRKTNALAADSLGNLWIGTDSGLVFYDGATWTIYNTSNSALAEDTVTVLTIVSNGDLWIGTKNQGAQKFDGTAFTTYSVGTGNLPLNRISFIFQDPFSLIWIGTLGGGIVKYDGTTWTPYNNSTIGSTLLDIATCMRYQSGNFLYYVGTDNGMVKFNGSSTAGTFFPTFAGLGTNIVTTMEYNPSNGLIYIGTGAGYVEYSDDLTFNAYTDLFGGFDNDDIHSFAIHNNTLLIGAGDSYMCRWRVGWDNLYRGLNFRFINAMDVDSKNN